MCSSAVEILPNLWLGNIKASRNRDFLHQCGINVIVNCTRNYDFDASAMLPNTRKVRVAVSDTGTEQANDDLLCLLDKCTDYIHMQLVNEHRVLVHCYAGKQRSPAVIAAFMIKYADLTVPEALQVLQSKWKVSPDRYNLALTRFREGVI